MPTFTYRALNENNRYVKGQITAANEIDLEERLKGFGLELVDCRQQKAHKKKLGGGGVKTKDLIVLCLHLEQLDRAGVPLLEALADVRDSSESPKLKDIMTDVYESVKNGDVLSDAFGKHPRVFGTVFVGLIKAGEKTGKLYDSFHHLADHLKWVAEMRRKVKKALGYPITLGIVVLGVLTVLMLFVVPKLTAFILNQGFDLPIHTRALIAFSKFFGDYWYIILPTPFVITIVLIISYRTSENFAYGFDNFMLHFPVLGNTIRKIDLARFTGFFALMFKSGIDVLESLQTAQSVVKNRVIKESVGMVRRAVSEGNSITNSLRVSNQFPNLVIRMFKVGEDSGNMNEALENVNFFYDREVNDAVDAMIGMIQPVMTVVLGGMILWIVAAIFGPLYDSFSKMNF